MDKILEHWKVIVARTLSKQLSVLGDPTLNHRGGIPNKGQQIVLRYLSTPSLVSLLKGDNSLHLFPPNINKGSEKKKKVSCSNMLNHEV